ncbi:MAG TPA: hypothetical protein VGA95_04235, partial [Thermodesulfobacteriota bacterium]
IPIIVLVFALMVVGLGFLIWSLYLYLATLLSPPSSALASGLLIIVISLCLVFCAKISMTRTASHKSAINNLLSSWLQNYPTETVLATIAAGLLVGVSSDVRRSIAEAATWLLKQNASLKDSSDQSK